MKTALFLMMSLGFLAPVQPQDIPKDVTGDPVAIDLYGEMIEVLHGAESLAFESKFSFYSIKEGKENFRQENTYKAWLMKPNYARIEVIWPKVGPMGTLVGDGDYFWLYWPEGTTFFTSAYRNRPGEKEYKVYMKKRTPVGRHSLAHEIGYIGNGSMCILELSAFHGYVESLTPYLGAITSKGEEKVGEERSMPDPNDALLSKGQIAPEFSLQDAKDGTITLADYHGKPVWLMFWRVG